MSKAVLLLGTNLGCKANNLKMAIQHLSLKVGALLQKSSVYVTPPWGFHSDNEFYNQVVVFNTGLQPFPLLNQLQHIEKNLGRVRKTDSSGYQDRLIDIDILFLDDLIFETQRLTIPHPHLHKRRFTLEPLHEILPQFIHPVLKKSISQILEENTETPVSKL